MKKVIDEKRKWSEDGASNLTRLVTYVHTSDSLPDTYEVRFNRDVVYQGDALGEAVTTFSMYEGMF
jgi:hypothetical protein